MFNRIIRSVSFGITFALAMLFSHNMEPSGKLPVWSEAAVRFLVASFTHLLFSAAVDFVRSKLKKKEALEV